MKKGDIVTVINRTLGGEEIIEGKAELVEKFGTCWYVHFLEDPKGEVVLRWNFKEVSQ